jgi:chromosome segregation ATPase
MDPSTTSRRRLFEGLERGKEPEHTRRLLDLKEALENLERSKTMLDSSIKTTRTDLEKIELQERELRKVRTSSATLKGRQSALSAQVTDLKVTLSMRERELSKTRSDEEAKREELDRVSSEEGFGNSLAEEDRAKRMGPGITTTSLQRTEMFFNPVATSLAHIIAAVQPLVANDDGGDDSHIDFEDIISKLQSDPVH